MSINNTKSILQQILQQEPICVGEIRTNFTLGIENIKEEDLNELKKALGFYQMKDGIYKIGYNSKSKQIYIKRLSDYCLTLSAQILQLQDIQDSSKKYFFELEVIKREESQGKFSCLCSEIIDKRKVLSKLDEICFNNSKWTDEEFADFMNENISKSEVDEIIEFVKAGYNSIQEQKYFVTTNKIIKYKDNDNSKTELRLYKDASCRPRFCTELLLSEEAELFIQEIQREYCIESKELLQKICLILFYTLQKAYNNVIEPFLIVGFALMFPFIKEIHSEFHGFPVAVLFGESTSGKSNILNIIAGLYGLDKNIICSGNDTFKALLNTAKQFSGIPVLLDEVGDELENKIEECLIKPIQEQRVRKRMNSSGEKTITTEVNTSLIINTNTMFLNKTESFNRTLFTVWDKENFNIDKAKKLNSLVSSLSLITKKIIEDFSVTEVLQSIEHIRNGELIQKIKDERSKINVAIAVAGLKCFIRLTGLSDKFCTKSIKEKLNNFIENYEKNFNETEIEKFFTVLRELVERKIIKYNTDYKKVDGGIHQQCLHIKTPKRQSTISTQFKVMYKRLYDNKKPLDFDYYIKKLIDNGCKKDTANYSGRSCHGIFIPLVQISEIAKFVDALELDIEENKQSSCVF